MLKDNIIIERSANFLIILPILWIFTGLFYFKNGDKILVVLTLISALISFIIYRSGVLKENLKNQYLWVMLFLLILSLFFDVFNIVNPLNIRSISIVCVLAIFMPYRLLSKKILSLIIFSGSLCSLLYIIHITFILKIPRALWPINAIPYSTYICVIGVLALINFLFIKNKILKTLSLVAVIFSIAAVMLSETRGAMIALLPTLLAIALYYTYTNGCSKKTWSYILIGSLLIIGGSFHILKDRLYDATAHEIATFNSGNENTSIGIRLNLWKAGLILIKESPFHGIANNMKDDVQQLVNQHKIYNNDYSIFSHFHNQYIDVAAKWGLQSLAFLLLILLVPLFRLNKTNSYTSISFISITSILMIAGLTDPPLINKQLFIMFFSLFTLIYGLNKKSESN
ncbi:O-antigen ligase family protein [Photobacterium kishitanii]|uniref:O-antigen ligase family protein n=1 Tax=Photobacterium kishitanii TaxID=318456 RepID=UPI0015E6584F|nr:O-antigen ligase family protein [Photobacterium kishitanii]